MNNKIICDFKEILERRRKRNHVKFFLNKEEMLERSRARPGSIAYFCPICSEHKHVIDCRATALWAECTKCNYCFSKRNKSSSPRGYYK